MIGPADCLICQTVSDFRDTGVLIARGKIFVCRNCGGFFLHPPVRVAYESSPWTAMRATAWQADVARGRLFAKKISDWFACQTSKRLTSVLEIGCGSAFMGPGFSDQGINYLGLDIDEYSLELARNRSIAVMSLRAEKIGSSSLVNEHFDLIISSNAFEHFNCPVDAFAGLAKLDFDQAVIIVPNPLGILPAIKASSLARCLIKAYLNSERDIAYTIDGYWHNIAYSKLTLRFLCDIAGLKINDLNSIGINDATFGFVQPNKSLSYRLVSGVMNLLDMQSQLKLIVSK